MRTVGMALTALGMLLVGAASGWEARAHLFPSDASLKGPMWFQASDGDYALISSSATSVTIRLPADQDFTIFGR